VATSIYLCTSLPLGDQVPLGSSCFCSFKCFIGRWNRFTLSHLLGEIITKISVGISWRFNKDEMKLEVILIAGFQVLFGWGSLLRL
jgi:hypothetical protein